MRKLRQKRSYVFLIVFFLVLSSGLFALGKKEEEEKPILNNEWILSVTNFNISALPPGRRIVGEVITRSLVNTFKALDYRIRISPEYAYYEGYAWAQARSTAAKALSAKQDERALLLYRGEPDWKYRQTLKTIDADIVKLQEEYIKKESEMPLIAEEPVFGITQGNRDGTFPEPPKKGAEYRFCQSQKADAFLSGEIREYHNRIYIKLRLYALYTRSFIYEDDIIFSSDDTAGAVDEIAGRLTAVLSGAKPAAIAVHAEPPETLVLINQTFAGRGDVNAMEHPQGKVIIALSAEDFKPEAIETELSAGELTEISMTLRPLDIAEINISAPGVPGVSVYQGAMYVGEAPLTLRLPINQLDYISLEALGGKSAKTAFYTPQMTGDSMPLQMKLKTPPSSGQKRVNKARRWYYWAWGGTWITGIAAWISYGLYSTQNTAIRQSSAVNPNDLNMDFYSDYQRMYYISMGAVITVGVAAVYEIFQIIRYVYVATEDATPIAK